jgi:O-antigen ligase
LSRSFIQVSFALCAFSLALTPLSTKLAGLAWLMFCILCFASAWHNRQSLHFVSDSPSSQALLVETAKIWLVCCLIAAILRIIPQALWHDDWSRRHAEARLLILAFGVYLGLRYSETVSIKSLKIWMAACCIACFLAFGITLWLQRNTPAHPIPWAVSMSLVICLMLPFALTCRERLFKAALWLCILWGVAGVLMSQSRGAYGIVPWVILVAVMSGFPVFGKSRYSKPMGFIVFLGLLCALLAWALNDANDTLRFQAFAAQWTASQSHLQEGANSSVGARLFLWQKGWDAIQVQPFVGFGAESSVLQIRAWGQVIQSEEVMRLGHLHNEFLDAWMSHGLLGLFSSLTWPAGLSYVCWRLRKQYPQTCLSLLGIAWMHVTAGMSNVNLSHNYYGTVLALCIGLALWLGQRESVTHD